MMIDVRELMVGNWINGSYNGFSKDIQVYCFDRKDIQHTNNKQYPLPIQYFNPIKLTEEWLLRFGFKKRVKGIFATFTPCGKGFCWRDGYCIFAGVTIETPVQYVHSLQNLYFALTNKELTIKTTTDFKPDTTDEYPVESKINEQIISTVRDSGNVENVGNTGIIVITKPDQKID